MKKTKKSKRKKSKKDKIISPNSKRLEKLRTMQIFDENYTQAYAAKKLHVSISTIKRDEQIITNQDEQWLYRMAKGGFMTFIHKWFGQRIKEIQNLHDDIDKIRKETSGSYQLIMSLLNDAIEELPNNESKFIRTAMANYHSQKMASKQAGIITLIDNTITNQINFCERLITRYPGLRTTQEYRAFLDMAT